jgi:hypothetical protein
MIAATTRTNTMPCHDRRFSTSSRIPPITA